MRWWAAHLDPFLHDWDERYHALVALNLAGDPAAPRLRAMPLIPFDYRIWTSNGIWLHKQPLFLWQMAAAIKLFGASEFTIRYPSILMGTLCIPMAYRLGYWFSGQRAVGIAASLLQCCSYFILKLISGEEGMDHNDVAMCFYTMASFWAYSHYDTSVERKLSWAIATGVFAGCAILNKWLPGLLVFGGWGINLLVTIIRTRGTDCGRQLRHFGFSLAACIAVFLPWQLYILHKFPLEAAYELAYNTKHLEEAVEGHRGGYAFFWNNFPDYFAPYLWGLVPLAFLYFAWMNLRSWRNSQGAILSCLLAAFLFYSLIVPTKVDSHFMFVAVFGLALVAAFLFEMMKHKPLTRGLYPIPVLAFAFLGLQHVRLLKLHDPAKADWQRQAYNTATYKSLRHELPPQTAMVINVPEFDHPLVMFYNPGIDAYHFSPTDVQLQPCYRDSVRIAFFPERPGYGIPDHVIHYPRAYPLRVALR